MDRAEDAVLMRQALQERLLDGRRQPLAAEGGSQQLFDNLISRKVEIALWTGPDTLGTFG